MKGTWHDVGEGISVKLVDEPFPPDCNCPIIDWTGLEENGVLLPYTEKTALRILKEYKHFREYISVLIYGDPFLDTLGEFLGALKDLEEKENE